MAYRKADAKLLGALIAIGIPIFLVVELYESLGPAVIATLLIAVVVLFALIKSHRTREHRYLMTKYRDPTIVSKIAGGQIWLGQTAEQVRDAIQSPVAIDNQQLKTKKREIWKYHRRGVNRYGLRITLENDIVVSWHKSTDSLSA